MCEEGRRRKIDIDSMVPSWGGDGHPREMIRLVHPFFASRRHDGSGTEIRSGGDLRRPSRPHSDAHEGWVRRVRLLGGMTLFSKISEEVAAVGAELDAVVRARACRRHYCSTAAPFPHVTTAGLDPPNTRR